MTRINIAGFFGFANAGDEAILLAMMDELGKNNQYIISTSLPHNLFDEYHFRLQTVEDVRSFSDIRIDYDVNLLGGGGLNWGYGWQQILRALAADKPCMNYGVGYRKDVFYHPKLHDYYRSFLNQFKAITVRDEFSQALLKEVGVESTLTMCPTINLREEGDSPEGKIAVCPRFEDFEVGNNTEQIKWIVNRLKGLEKDVLLIPFSQRDLEGNLRDLYLCRELANQLKGSEIFYPYRYHPRQIKYAISKSKLVISGGRYHAIVWAAAHNIPYEVYPSALKNYFKIQNFIEVHQKYGLLKLKEMEKKNVEIFWRILSDS